MKIENFKKAYQFEIFFRDLKPKIWRRFQVLGTISFWDLHIVIQGLMGWVHKGRHEFYAQSIETHKVFHIGLIDEGLDDMPFLFSRSTKIKNYFSQTSNVGYYNYPLGHEWTIEIRFEKCLPCEPGVFYPMCLDGARAAPPEDCQTADAYEHLLKVMRDPKHREYQQMVKKFGTYDPNVFDKAAVYFSEPDTESEYVCAGTKE